MTEGLRELADLAAARNVLLTITPDQARQIADELDALRREIEQTKKRYTWAANELLACDYGDNDAAGKQIGWRVFGWRDRDRRRDRRIYGDSIDVAIDAELARKAS